MRINYRVTGYGQVLPYYVLVLILYREQYDLVGTITHRALIYITGSMLYLKFRHNISFFYSAPSKSPPVGETSYPGAINSSPPCRGGFRWGLTIRKIMLI